jgi:hypothetical protein
MKIDRALFIVGVFTDDTQDLLFAGLAVFAASFLVESLPLDMMGTRSRTRV